MKKLAMVTMLIVCLSLVVTGALASQSEDLKVITANALCDHDIDDTEWQFIITGVSDGPAPESIDVNWVGSITETISLDKVTGNAAHYVTVNNLDLDVVSATALIFEDWDGQFVISHGPACHSTGIWPLSKYITIDDTCALEDNGLEWQFVITGVAGDFVPEWVDVEWSGGEVESVGLIEAMDGSAFYATTDHLDQSVVSASTYVDELWEGQFVISHGPACAAPNWFIFLPILVK